MEDRSIANHKLYRGLGGGGDNTFISIKGTRNTKIAELINELLKFVKYTQMLYIYNVYFLIFRMTF